MATNRFQRWLSKKNESLEESQEEASLPTLDDGITNVTDITPSDGLTVESKEHSVEHEIMKQAADHEADVSQHSHLATIAHVFEEGVSKLEKQRQLRALFHSGEFSEIDPLDSYNMDYTKVKSLPKDIAETLRSWHKRVDDLLDENEEIETSRSQSECESENEQALLAHVEHEQSEIEESIDTESLANTHNNDAIGITKKT